MFDKIVAGMQQITKIAMSRMRVILLQFKVLPPYTDPDLIHNVKESIDNEIIYRRPPCTIPPLPPCSPLHNSPAPRMTQSPH